MLTTQQPPVSLACVAAAATPKLNDNDEESADENSGAPAKRNVSGSMQQWQIIARLQQAELAASTRLSKADQEQLQRESSASGPAVAPTDATSGELRGRPKRADGIAPTDGAARAQSNCADKLVVEEDGDDCVSNEPVDPEFSAQLVWRNIVLFVILHSSLLFGARMLWLGQVRIATLGWSLLVLYASMLGVTGGTHRLWSHRAYKARWPLQVLLMLLQTTAGQNSIWTWSRDHRVHHKFAETSADPHNIKRGFFFAHMGWLCCRKHPDVKSKGAQIDMSDLEANPVVMFQHKHFWWLSLLCNALAPSTLPVLLWNESFAVAFTFAFLWRYMISLHGTWLVNSAAHYYGSRPYDGRIEARESPMVIMNLTGEGFHNYHHTFPHDYATSEWGRYMNITTAFIDLCAWLGLAYERRTMSRAMIARRRARTGQKPAADQDEQQLKKALGKELDAAAASELGVAARAPRSSEQRNLVNNIIHELPYISGLFTMKYTV